MDLLEFMVELDIQYYLEMNNMIQFTLRLSHKCKKWHEIYMFSYYAKIKAESQNSLLLENTMTFHNVIILRKLVFNKDKNNYCYNMFSEKLLMIYLKIKFLYKILMICYDRIDFSKGINVNSTSKSKEYVI